MSASPGLFFALLGAFIVWSSLRHGFEIKVDSKPMITIERFNPNESTKNDSTSELSPGEVRSITFSVYKMGSSEASDVKFQWVSIAETLSADELSEIAKRGELWKLVRWQTINVDETQKE